MAGSDKKKDRDFRLFSCMFGHIFEMRATKQAVPRCTECARRRRWSSEEDTPSFGQLVTDEITYAIYRLGGPEAAARHHFGTEESVDESREFLLGLVPVEVKKKIYGE